VNDLPEVRRELAEYYHATNRMDYGVGAILRHLAELGLTESTIVVFLSDNGPPFINSKTTLYDAGVRLPLLVLVPGRMPGFTNEHMVSWIDILPAFLDWPVLLVGSQRKGFGTHDEGVPFYRSSMLL
jgi:N-sulfoglucosamine sulfohydrolase